jgi:hypothetical protein
VKLDLKTSTISKESILKESGLKGSEISGDIVKWLVYDALEDKVCKIFLDLLYLSVIPIFG